MKVVLSAVLAMFLVACGNNTQEKKEQESVKTETATVAQTKAPESVEKAVVKEVKAVEEPIAQKVETIVAEVKEVKTVAAEPVKAPEPVKVEEKIAAVAPKPVAKSSVDGGALFVKCVACHGQNAEKSALGKSQIIKGWSADKVLSALHGYKDGTYGGAMKGIMKSQVSAYSEDELKALAQHISKL